MVAFTQGGKFCTGDVTVPVECKASAISAAEKFIIKCVDNCVSSPPRNTKIATCSKETHPSFFMKTCTPDELKKSKSDCLINGESLAHAAHSLIYSFSLDPIL